MFLPEKSPFLDEGLYGWIEAAFSCLRHVQGIGYNGKQLRRNSDRGDSGRGIQSSQFAVVVVQAHHVVYASDLCERCINCVINLVMALAISRNDNEGPEERLAAADEISLWLAACLAPQRQA